MSGGYAMLDNAARFWSGIKVVVGEGILLFGLGPCNDEFRTDIVLVLSSISVGFLCELALCQTR